MTASERIRAARAKARLEERSATVKDDDDRSYNDSVTDWLETPVSTFPGAQPERIEGQLGLEDDGTLGPCGCVDYHMADCDGGRAMTKDDYLDLYAGSYPDDWPDDEGMW